MGELILLTYSLLNYVLLGKLKFRVSVSEYQLFFLNFHSFFENNEKKISYSSEANFASLEYRKYFFCFIAEYS